jgi:hypothetical protein
MRLKLAADCVRPLLALCILRDGRMGAVRLSSRASVPCAARDLGAPIGAGARKARICNANCTLPAMNVLCVLRIKYYILVRASE